MQKGTTNKAVNPFFNGNKYDNTNKTTNVPDKKYC